VRSKFAFISLIRTTGSVTTLGVVRNALAATS
jgi:hypothetical protein